MASFPESTDILFAKVFSLHILLQWYFEEVATHCATVSSIKSTHSVVSVTRHKEKNNNS